MDVNRDDLSHGRLSVIVPDDREATCDRDEAGADIAESRPQPTVVGHVHESTLMSTALVTSGEATPDPPTWLLILQLVVRWRT